MKFKGVFCVFFDGLSDFEKDAVFCATDSENARNDIHPLVMRKLPNTPAKMSLKSCAGEGWKRVANQ
jgi:hypothetical protein